MANLKFRPVENARHPSFHSRCSNCGKITESPKLYIEDSAPAFSYICDRCVFTYGLISLDNMRRLEEERDRLEFEKFKTFCQ